MSNGLEWRPLCDVDAVEPGTHKVFHLGGRRLCAINDGGVYHVLDDQCTHGVAYLSEGYLDTDEAVVECPLHGGLFCYRDGSPKGDPAEKPVRSHPTRIEGRMVSVGLRVDPDDRTEEPV